MGTIGYWIWISWTCQVRLPGLSCQWRKRLLRLGEQPCTICARCCGTPALASDHVSVLQCIILRYAVRVVVNFTGLHYKTINVYCIQHVWLCQVVQRSERVVSKVCFQSQGTIFIHFQVYSRILLHTLEGSPPYIASITGWSWGSGLLLGPSRHVGRCKRNLALGKRTGGFSSSRQCHQVSCFNSVSD